MSKGLLATVAAAAAASTELPASAGNQPEEQTMSTATDKPAAPATITSLAALQASYPQLFGDVQAAARIEGATAERERIAAIDKLARPGREKIIAAAKADPAMTADKTAVALLAADDAAKDVALKNIKSVEDEGGKVATALTPAGIAADAPALGKASSPEGWKAEYAASEALQREFTSAETYVAYRGGLASGRVRILNQKSA